MTADTSMTPGDRFELREKDGLVEIWDNINLCYYSDLKQIFNLLESMDNEMLLIERPADYDDQTQMELFA